MHEHAPHQTLDETQTGRISLLWAVVCSLFLAISAQWPGLVNQYVVNDDVRQQLFWMQRWTDPQLYPPDLLSDYSRCYVPWGVQGLYRFGALFVDPLYFSKFVAVALMAFLGGLVFLVARRVGGRHVAWLTMAGLWLMPAFIENISGGLARAFAAPLLALFLYAQISHSRPLAIIAILAQALFIPYVLPVCLGASIMQFIAWKIRLLPSPPLLHSPSDAFFAGGAMGLVFLWQAGMAMEGFGPLPWGAQIAGRPEFGEAGRFAILPAPSVFWELFGRPWRGLVPFLEGGVAVGVFCSLLFLPLMALGASRLEWRAIRGHLLAPGFLLASSLVLYFAANMLLLKLFIPSRYLEYTTNVLYCFGVPLLLSPVLLPFFRRCSSLVIMFFLAAALFVGAIRQHGRELYDYSMWKDLYEFVQQTPQDSLFAGYPELMDNVLTFGQRNVYASFELAHPWSTGYWARLRPRFDRLLRAYYGSSPEEIKDFCAQEGISFLVVDRRHFEQEFIQSNPLFEPFRSFIKLRLEERKPFALLSDAFHTVKIDENIHIIDMRINQRVMAEGQQ